MPLCKNCEHNCHHSNSGKCASCDCLNCEHDIKDALIELEKVLDPIKVVEFEPAFDLTEH